MYKKNIKRPLTLLEIMIVIFLIGLIGSVIGYNMKGSLDEGKAFKTEHGAALIRDILLLEVAKGRPMEDVIAKKEKYIENSGLSKDPKKLLKDGWGFPFEIRPSRNNSDIVVRSEKLVLYKNQKKKKLGEDIAVEEENEKEEE